MLTWGSFWHGMGEWEYLLRMVISCVCGFAIGLERTKRQKEAGLRTHILVALGASMVMIVSKYGFFDMLGTGVNVDATRIGSTILTAISFLGAGIILQRGDSVRGLTTAAGVWVTGGVGVAIGAGMYALGLGCTLLVVFIQIVFKGFTQRYAWSDTPDNLFTLRIQGDAHAREFFALWLREHMPEARVSHMELQTDSVIYTLLLNDQDLQRAPAILSTLGTEDAPLTNEGTNATL